jgi:addiction module HigA family antidote
MPRLDANFSTAIHPGDILREMLEDMGISQAQFARHLKTDTARINEICRRRRGISARMAVMLGHLRRSVDESAKELGPESGRSPNC